MMSSSPPAPSPQLQPAGGSFLTGYTRLCKGLAVILVIGFAFVQIFPSAVAYLALIPSRTIPFAWNLFTAGYIEQTIPGVIISIIGLLVSGKLLEPLWGSKEFLKFIIVVNLSTSVCIFATAILLYYFTTQENYLYTSLSGFHGVLSGFLVGVKQILPDQELNFLKIKAKVQVLIPKYYRGGNIWVEDYLEFFYRVEPKFPVTPFVFNGKYGKWIPSLVASVSIAVSFFMTEAMSYLPAILFGMYASWTYLRYFQKRPETGLKGDPSDEFSFSSFFPEFLRPVLDPIASIFDKIFCGRFRNGTVESRDQALDGSPLPGSDLIEAARRRERGARALEQRLAAEKNIKVPDGMSHDNASDNV